MNPELENPIERQYCALIELTGSVIVDKTSTDEETVQTIRAIIEDKMTPKGLVIAQDEFTVEQIELL